MSGPPPVLGYSTLRYRHHRSQWGGAAALTGGLIVGLAFMHRRGVTVDGWVWAAAVGTGVALTVVALLPPFRSECRIEGDQLWFRFHGGRPVGVPIDDVIAIDRVTMTDAADRFEVVVRGRGRMAVPVEVFEPIDPLRAAVRAINPGVRFGDHAGTHCRACGADLYPDGGRWTKRRPACPTCGEPVARLGRFN